MPRRKEIEVQLGNFCHIVRRLSTYDMVIPEKILVAIFFESLPESFEQFTQMILISKEEQRFHNVKDLVLNEAQSRIIKAGYSKDAALYTAGHGRRNTRCNFCKRFKHAENDCWKKHQRSPNT